jgi:hypothetical protein
VRARVGYSLAAITTASLGALGAMRWRTAAPEVVEQPLAIESSRRVADADSLEQQLSDAEDLIVTNDPFRLANAPASMRYDPNTDGVAVAGRVVAPPPPRPVMTLKAIVGGPPWQAVVDGLPGQPPGTVVRSGATFDKLVARAVTRDSVVIQGPDTTWVLSFRRRP